MKKIIKIFVLLFTAGITQAQTQLVGLSDDTPSEFLDIEGSPIAGSPALNGTILLSFDEQNGRKFLSAPIDGGFGVPSFRGILSSDLPTANSTTQAGIVSTSTQTFGGIKTFDNDLFIYNATAARKFGINTNSPSYVFDMRPAAADNYNPIFLVRNGDGGNGFLMDLEDNNMRFGIFDKSNNTMAKLRSNGISFISLRFEVGENLQDVDMQNPQFKVLGTQNFVTDPSDMTFYQQTIQNHTNTTGASASLGFGVDQGVMDEEGNSDDVFEIDNQKIGAYITHLRTGSNSLGSLNFGVMANDASAPANILSLSGTQVTFPQVAAASSIAAFDASKNLVSGTIHTSTSGLQLSSNALSLNINNLAIASAVDKTNDYVAIYDASASATVKAKITDVVAGYTLQGSTNNITSIADAASYYFGAISDITGSTANMNRVFIPKAGTIKAIYVYFYNGNTSTNENGTLAVKINNGSDITITTTIKNNNSSTIGANTNMSTVVNQGDYLEIKWTTPTWTTNPDLVRATFVVYIE